MKAFAYWGGLLSFGLCSVALGDVVILDDGSRVEGRVVAEGTEVTIEVDGGRVSFPATEVERVERASTPLHELDRRWRRLGARDVGGRRSLARWATAQGFHGAAAALYREVVALSPSDREARRALGHRLLKGQWVTEAVAMRAAGRVRYEGRWIDKAEADKLEEAFKARVEARRAREAAAKAEPAEGAASGTDGVPLELLEGLTEEERGFVLDAGFWRWYPTRVLPSGYQPAYWRPSRQTTRYLFTQPVFPPALFPPGPTPPRGFSPLGALRPGTHVVTPAPPSRTAPPRPSPSAAPPSRAVGRGGTLPVFPAR